MFVHCQSEPLSQAAAGPTPLRVVPYIRRSLRGGQQLTFVEKPSGAAGVLVFLLPLNAARHVGHMEQHPGAQEAAGLSAGEAAATAERPSTTVGGYVQTGRRAPAGATKI